jgi:putative transport protein
VDVDVYEVLRANPLLVFFLTLGLGFLLGRMRFGPLRLGPTAGVLLIGLWHGHLGFTAPEQVQVLGFILFIYSVGVAAGPRFFTVVRASGSKYFALAAVNAATGFFLALWLSGWLELDYGMAAGVLAGALTSTPTLAAAQDAIQSGVAELPAGVTAQAAIRNVTTSYAISYVLGLAGVMLLVHGIPRLFRVDLREEARSLAKEMRLPDEAGDKRKSEMLIRAYEIQNEQIAGRSLKDLDLGRLYQIVVAEIRRGDELTDAEGSTVLQVGDRVSALASFDEHQRAEKLLGPPVQDRELLDERIENAEVVVTRDSAVNQTLGELNLTGERGCFVSKVVRSQVELPGRGDLVVQKGDTLYLTGIHRQVHAVARQFGRIEAEIRETDLLTFALGIVVGLLLGQIRVQFETVSIELGSAGGLLLAGIMVGFLRSMHPTFGRVPEAAGWVLREMGLLFFMASVGLEAGAGFVETLLAAGPGLLLCGAAVTLLAPLATYLVGAWIFRLNPAILMGCICGAMTSTPALGLVSESTKSQVPALGYAGTYTFANVMLTFAGSLMMRL